MRGLITAGKEQVMKIRLNEHRIQPQTKTRSRQKFQVRYEAKIGYNKAGGQKDMK